MRHQDLICKGNATDLCESLLGCPEHSQALVPLFLWFAWIVFWLCVEIGSCRAVWILGGLGLIQLGFCKSLQFKLYKSRGIMIIGMYIYIPIPFYNFKTLPRSLYHAAALYYFHQHKKTRFYRQNFWQILLKIHEYFKGNIFQKFACVCMYLVKQNVFFKINFEILTLLFPIQISSSCLL